MEVLGYLNIKAEVKLILRHDLVELIMDKMIIADEISKAISQTQQIVPFSKRGIFLSLQDAYDVAGLVKESLGLPPEIGKKIGFTNRNIWDVYNVNEPIWGPITSKSVSFAETSFQKIDLSQFCEPRIEPEVVICLREKPRHYDEDLNIFIDWIAPGFEVVDSIYANWSFALPDTIASGGLHGCLVIGKKLFINNDVERDLADLKVRLFKDASFEEEGTGANVLDGPVSAVRYLHKSLAAIKNQVLLSSGNIITTGTMTDAKPVFPGEKWTGKFEGIIESDLSVEFL